ncbi:MAG TPA: PLP-dependent aspartate aminotransferase family protein [Acidimicrobiales bacterium]|nr:PLP-dependent aspartate aminotransferase family protein [Acidimicrobiales bacterium]
MARGLAPPGRGDPFRRGVGARRRDRRRRGRVLTSAGTPPGQSPEEPPPPSAPHPSTVAVSSGRRHDPGAPLGDTVELSSTYRAGGPVIYGRESNPGWEALEAVVGALEGGAAVAFASGMAAIAAVAELAPAGGRVAVASGAYKGTRQLFDRLDAVGRVHRSLVDVTDAAAVASAAASGAGVLWLESPTNPLLGIADIAAASAAAGGAGHGALVVVDNTFASPLLQRPLLLGADVVVHSATKLLSGHSDVLLGVAVARDEAIAERLREHRSTFGSIPGPMETFLALRGVRTLAVRVERAQATAAELACRLAAHPAVEAVLYPGLESHPGHEVAARQMDGFGTMISFVVRGGAPGADAVCERVRLVVPATSLGGVESMIERRAKYAGEGDVPAGLLRFSVGLEHVDDLWADLTQALSSLR